jgi:2-methylaconitate isomerase
MGGATSSTSKTVILSRSASPDHDVDYLFGQVSIDQPFVDWSGNCGNLTAAVGSFAISNGLVDPAHPGERHLAVVRIWQANIEKTIIAHVPITNGQVQETGDFELDGVTFPAAEVGIEFIAPTDGTSADVPDRQPGRRVRGARLRHCRPPDQRRHSDHVRQCRRHRLQTAASCRTAINDDPASCWPAWKCIRAHGAVAMGLIKPRRGRPPAPAHAQGGLRCANRRATPPRAASR